MKVDSLNELTVAFTEWRRGKQHVRETVPDRLLERARRGAEVHGVSEVVRAVRVERSRLFRHRPGGPEEKSATALVKRPAQTVVPAFSRLALPSPPCGAAPIAELETPTGLKLRVFADSAAMVGLLTSLCGMGGAR